VSCWSSSLPTAATSSGRRRRVHLNRGRRGLVHRRGRGHRAFSSVVLLWRGHNREASLCKEVAVGGTVHGLGGLAMAASGGSRNRTRGAK
jgi:hypothetical protein